MAKKSHNNEKVREAPRSMRTNSLGSLNHAGANKLGGGSRCPSQKAKNSNGRMGSK